MKAIHDFIRFVVEWYSFFLLFSQTIITSDARPLDSKETKRETSISSTPPEKPRWFLGLSPEFLVTIIFIIMSLTCATTIFCLMFNKTRLENDQVYDKGSKKKEDSDKAKPAESPKSDDGQHKGAPHSVLSQQSPKSSLRSYMSNVSKNAAITSRFKESFEPIPVQGTSSITFPQKSELNKTKEDISLESIGISERMDNPSTQSHQKPLGALQRIQSLFKRNPVEKVNPLESVKLENGKENNNVLGDDQQEAFHVTKPLRIQTRFPNSRPSEIKQSNESSKDVKESQKHSQKTPKKSTAPSVVIQEKNAKRSSGFGGPLPVNEDLLTIKAVLEKKDDEDTQPTSALENFHQSFESQTNTANGKTSSSNGTTPKDQERLQSLPADQSVATKAAVQQGDEEDTEDLDVVFVDKEFSQSIETQISATDTKRSFFKGKFRLHQGGHQKGSKKLKNHIDSQIITAEKSQEKKLKSKKPKSKKIALNLSATVSEEKNEQVGEEPIKTTHESKKSESGLAVDAVVTSEETETDKIASTSGVGQKNDSLDQVLSPDIEPGEVPEDIISGDGASIAGSGKNTPSLAQSLSNRVEEETKRSTGKGSSKKSVETAERTPKEQPRSRSTSVSGKQEKEAATPERARSSSGHRSLSKAKSNSPERNSEERPRSRSSSLSVKQKKKATSKSSRSTSAHRSLSETKSSRSKNSANSPPKETSETNIDIVPEISQEPITEEGNQEQPTSDETRVDARSGRVKELTMKIEAEAQKSMSL